MARVSRSRAGPAHDPREAAQRTKGTARDPQGGDFVRANSLLLPGGGSKDQFIYVVLLTARASLWFDRAFSPFSPILSAAGMSLFPLAGPRFPARVNCVFVIPENLDIFLR